mgnify:CR=1 FL=1
MRSTLNAGEFYQEHSHSDATPLDCDFGYITKDNLGAENDYKVAISSISRSYGNTWIVLKKYDERKLLLKRNRLTLLLDLHLHYFLFEYRSGHRLLLCLRL